MTPTGTPSVLPAEECLAFGPALAITARDDPVMYRLLLTRLIDANTDDLADLPHAVERREWPGGHRSVHRLKGSAALARCPTLIAAGKSIESAARHHDVAVVNALLPRYVAIVTEFNNRLRDLHGNRRHAATTFKEFEEAVHQARVQAPGSTGTLWICSGSAPIRLPPEAPSIQGGRPVVGDLQSLLDGHGLMLVFLNVLAEQAGLPVPAYPMLFVAGALSMQPNGPSIGAVLFAVISACLIADTAWYFAGKRLGQPMLRTICRVSISPDTCIRQTQSLYLRVGPRSLIFAKLLPGAGALSTSMAGMTATPFATFIFYDALGALVWAGGALVAGMVFSDFIDTILAAFSAFGHIAIMVVLGAFALFIAWRFWMRWRLLRRSGRIPRMTVMELEQRRASPDKPVVVIDVRAHGATPLERIPGSIVMELKGPYDSLSGQDTSADIVVYCACPHEMSAAVLAERLRTAGYPNTFALAGGFDEWKRLQGSPGLQTTGHDAPQQAPAH